MRVIKYGMMLRILEVLWWAFWVLEGMLKEEAR